MEAFVYCWTDSKTNMLYVGSHKGSDTDSYICSSRYMLSEYKKRPSDFSRAIIAYGSHLDMLVLESKILQSANAAKSKEFYNMHNNNGVYRSMGPKSEACKEKIKNSAIGRKRSVESRVNQSLSVTGQNNHFFGKTHTEQVRKRLSEQKKTQYLGEGNPNGKSVIYRGVRYGTKQEMTNKTGISLYLINKMIETKEVVIA